jgi:hypothetical protein
VRLRHPPTVLRERAGTDPLLQAGGIAFEKPHVEPARPARAAHSNDLHLANRATQILRPRTVCPVLANLDVPIEPRRLNPLQLSP